MATSTIDTHETVQQSDEKRSHTMALPPLENGDRLTREEFEKRYAAMPEVKKAELIDGVVHMGSPVRFGKHSEPHAALLTWLGTYAAFTQGVRLGDNATVRLDSDTEPQPDALLRIEPEVGGSSRISEDDYIEGRARVGRRNLFQYCIVRSARQNGCLLSCRCERVSGLARGRQAG